MTALYCITALIHSLDQARPLLMMHVMPWFTVSERELGWHWRMNRDSAELRKSGRVASHFRPLIGPYDSADAAVLELQTLWMKTAGIDGVLADWYGTQDHFDYREIHHRTQLLFDAATKCQLKIGVVYEDQTVRNAIANGLVAPDRKVAIAAETGLHLKRWFSNKFWWRIQDKPVLCVFGPQAFAEPEWDSLKNASGDHHLLTLHDPKPYAAGVYDWPIPSRGVNFNLDFWKRYSELSIRIPVAYPRFRDWYQEGGQSGYPVLPDADGVTLKQTLKRALQMKPHAVQFATWNDWQEGTQIEPSIEYGTRDLKTIQSARREIDPSFTFSPADLALPLRLFRLRQKKVSPMELDRVADDIRDGNVGAARRKLDEIEKSNNRGLVGEERLELSR